MISIGMSHRRSIFWAIAIAAASTRTPGTFVAGGVAKALISYETLYFRGKINPAGWVNLYKTFKVMCIIRGIRR